MEKIARIIKGRTNAIYQRIQAGTFIPSPALTSERNFFHVQPRQQQKKDVQQHEERPAVGARHIWEAPDVAEADGASGREHDEAEA